MNRLLLLLTSFALIACGGKQKPNKDWLHEDDVHVAVDETFEPVLAEIVEAFGLEHPEGTMYPSFVSEDSAVRLLVRDSIRCCVVTRPLNEAETTIVQSHKLSANTSIIAYDAIALITSNACPDSLITVDELRGIVTGRITKWEQLKNSSQKGALNLVFDHSGSSTVRFMRDSLCGGKELSGNVFASDSGTNQNVIEMVKRDPTIIGVVGANWLRGDSEEARTSFKGLDFAVMKVSRTNAADAFYCRPFQYYIGTGSYPLYRTVYVIHTDPRTKSNVKSLYFYLKGQRGQTLITKCSQMLPSSPVFVKGVNIKK